MFSLQIHNWYKVFTTTTTVCMLYFLYKHEYLCDTQLYSLFRLCYLENLSTAGTAAADRHCCRPFSHATLLVLVINKSLYKKITKRNLVDVGMAQCMNALADKEEVPCAQWYALHTMATWCTTVDSSVTRIKMDRYFGYTNLHDYVHVCASLHAWVCTDLDQIKTH